MDKYGAVEDIISRIAAENTGRPMNEETKLYIQLQKEYEQRFGEPLVFCVVGHEERSHIEVLQECLRMGKPYDDGTNIDPDIKY